MAGDPHTVQISGNNLTLAEVAAVARGAARVELSRDPKVLQRVSASRRALEEKLQNGEIIYGVNTGYGGNVRFVIPPHELRRHQENLFRYMICGVGAPLPEDTVRASILLRANALSKGYSAVRPIIIERLLDLLNQGITPIVPRYGSVGASGDLIPSAYIGRALLGEGEVVYRRRTVMADKAFKEAKLEPIRLEAKEALALVNGTTVMTGIAALVLYDGWYLTRLTLACAALAVEALQATDDPFREPIQRIKNHPGQLEAAALCSRLLEGSRYVRNLDEIRARIGRTLGLQRAQVVRLEEAIQSPYSLRCVPQGLGPLLDALREHREVAEREINSANDNPLVDPDDGRVYHTGNFYGGHTARALDSWKIDLATIGNWLHALMAVIVDDKFSNGLPPNLVRQPGILSGFKGTQLCLTSLVCALRHLSNPSLIHMLPTEQYNQDMVSLGTHAAITAMDMTEIAENAAALVLIALCQAVDLRDGGGLLGHGDRPIYECIRREVSFVDDDRPLDSDITKVKTMIRGRLIPLPEVKP